MSADTKLQASPEHPLERVLRLNVSDQLVFSGKLQNYIDLGES
jgi:hypothetical protein